MGAPGGGPVEAYATGTVPDGPGFWFPPTVVAPARADPGLLAGSGGTPVQASEPEPVGVSAEVQ